MRAPASVLHDLDIVAPGVRVDPGTAAGTAVGTAADRLATLGARIAATGTASPDTLVLAARGAGFAADVVVGRADRTEGEIQAESGIVAVHGRAEGELRPLGVDHVGVLTGVATSQAVLALTLAHLRGGAAPRAELSPDRIALLAMGQYLAAATATEDPERGGPPAECRPPFVSADGAAFEIEAFDAEAWQAFWAALGAPTRSVARSWRPFLLRYERATLALPRELQDAVGTQSFAAVAAAGERCRVSVCRVRTAAERMADPGFGAAPWLLGTGPRARPRPRPVTGPLPLAGVHVVESTRRVQGPMASRVLAMLGATVTRIEPPGGDPLRGMPPAAGDVSAKYRVLNDGKRTVEIDLKSRSGRAEVLDLVRGADAFLHNWAPGRAAALGLDVTDLHAAEPGLVCASATGWGDALGSAPPAGTDFTVQAHSGIAAALSHAGRPARPTLLITVDVLGGFVAAEGMLAALIARQRGGRGGTVTTSLLAATDPLLVRRSSPDEQVFAAEDGPLVVDVGRTAAALGLCGPDDDLRAVVADELRRRPREELVAGLRAAGVPAAVVTTDLATVPARRPELFDDVGCAVVRSPWSFDRL